MNNFIVSFLASILIWVMFGGIALWWVIDGKVKKEEAVHALLASAGAWVLAEMIKSIFPTPRPFEVNGYPAFVFWLPGDGAFPSGHTAAIFGLATSIWLHNKKLGIFYLVGAFLVGMARVWANVHFPIDIVGGVALGVATALGVNRIHIKS